jgi:hypothetical protein
VCNFVDGIGRNKIQAQKHEILGKFVMQTSAFNGFRLM